jgi:hypothetical protein
MTHDQKEFIELARRAVRSASPIAYPTLCAIRDDNTEEASEMVLRFALTNGLTPQEAMPHIETCLTES